MFGNLIRHNKENVTFYTLTAFKKLLMKGFGVTDKEVGYDSKNRGVTVGKHFWTWSNLASELGWFDDAEIVTDKNENEKVMTWLNLD